MTETCRWSTGFVRVLYMVSGLDLKLICGARGAEVARVDDMHALRPFRELQELVSRSLRSLLHVVHHAGPQHHVADVVRGVHRWLLRVTGDAQNAAPPFGVPRVEVPAWWRFVDDLDRFDDHWVAWLPDNWRGLSMPELRAVADTMERTGWVLAWVPRDEILLDLIDAPDRQAANSRLLTHQDDVLDDLKKELGEVTDSSLADMSFALQQGVRSYEGGLSFPAQALVAVVLTSVIKQQLDRPDLAGVGERSTVIDVGESPLLTFRRNSLLRAGGTALNSYWPRPGDPVPSLFHPYATAHHFDLTHFTQANALAGLVLGVSFLRDLQAVADQ
jgi:hypothetical protein